MKKPKNALVIRHQQDYSAELLHVVSAPLGLRDHVEFVAKGVAVSGAAARLSDPSMSSNMKALSARIKADPGFALELLVDAGIATKSGRLAKRYGG